MISFRDFSLITEKRGGKPKYSDEHANINFYNHIIGAIDKDSSVGQKMRDAIKDKDYQTISDIIEKEFSGLISISEISKRVMGKKYFMSATEEQRKRFNNKFKETFFKTYSSALSNLEDQKIEVIGHAHPKDKPNAAIVRVRITSGEDSYDLNYQMIKKKNRWGVINIIFSGVNIVSIFKTQFSSLASEYQDDLDKVIDGWEISDIRQNS